MAAIGAIEPLSRADPSAYCCPTGVVRLPVAAVPVGMESSHLHYFCGEPKAASSGAARRAFHGFSCPRYSSLSNFVTMDAQKQEIGRQEAEDPENVSLYVGVSCGRAFRPFAALMFSTTRPDSAGSQRTER
jgi:hypothetical protein